VPCRTPRRLSGQRRRPGSLQSAVRGGQRPLRRAGQTTPRGLAGGRVAAAAALWLGRSVALADTGQARTLGMVMVFAGCWGILGRLPGRCGVRRLAAPHDLEYTPSPSRPPSRSSALRGRQAAARSPARTPTTKSNAPTPAASPHTRPSTPAPTGTRGRPALGLPAPAPCAQLCPVGSRPRSRTAVRGRPATRTPECHPRAPVPALPTRCGAARPSGDLRNRPRPGTGAPALRPARDRARSTTRTSGAAPDDEAR